MKDALDMIRLGETIREETDAFARGLYATRLQAVADAVPHHLLRDGFVREMRETLRGMGLCAERRQVGPRQLARGQVCGHVQKDPGVKEEHMHYEQNAAQGVPIGSGAMESQCSQNQNRFKRRGQFWSEDGFAQARKVYVRYTNGELDYCFSKRSAGVRAA